MGSITDYLTCGQCLKEFPLQKITQFIQHKKLDCDDDVEDKIEDPELQCNYCPQGFMTAWGLLIHAQISHNLKIFLEKASKSLFKDNRLYPVKTDINTTALPFSSSEEVLPFKAIAESIDDVSKESTVDTRLISSNLLHIPIPSVNIMQKSSMLKTANSTSSRFGSNIVVTRDLLSDKSSGSSLTLVQSTNQSANICPLNIINEPKGNSSLKISPVKIVESFSSGTSPNDLSTMLHNIENTEVFQKAKPEVKDNDKGDTMEVNKEETIVKPKKMMEVEKSKTDVVGCPENTESEDKCIDGETELDEGSECCDIQGCGVTVIPGTHQDLQKCCNAVVPKKRKRHMEMKHMPFSWSSSRYARRRMYRNLSNVKPMSSTNLAKQAASSIYIEVESEPPDKQARSNNNNNSIDFDNQSLEDTDMQTDSNVTMSQVKASEVQVKTLSSAEMKPRSLILKPGAIFSIPFTYTIPTSSSISTLQINPSVTMKTKAQGSPVLATTLNQNDLPEGPSSQDNEKENGAQSTETRKSQKSNKDLDFSPKKYATSKPFHCEICPMAFNQRIHLKKHIMSKHTGNKPFKCDECDYSTVERSHLKVHIRIHTGEKPFKCTYCEYATAQNSTLKIHLKRHHGGKMFHCISCEKEFTQERQLKGHECENAVVINPERKTTTQVSSSTSVQLKPTTTAPEPSMQSLQGDNSAEKDSQSVEQITSLVASPIQKPGSVDMVGQNTAPE